MVEKRAGAVVARKRAKPHRVRVAARKKDSRLVVCRTRKSPSLLVHIPMAEERGPAQVPVPATDRESDEVLAKNRAAQISIVAAEAMQLRPAICAARANQRAGADSDIQSRKIGYHFFPRPVFACNSSIFLEAAAFVRLSLNSSPASRQRVCK